MTHYDICHKHNPTRCVRLFLLPITCCMLASYFAYSSTLKMVVTCSSEMLGDVQQIK
jgi:hypothetical protein